MLISAFSDVAAAERKILATQALHDQVNTELNWVKEVHMSEIFTMQQRLDSIREDLEASQTECLRAQARASAACVRADSFRTQLEATKAKTHQMAEEITSLELKLQEITTAWAKSEEEWRTGFLASAEFKEAVIKKVFSYFETGFQKCHEQYEEAGLSSVDKENFPDFVPPSPMKVMSPKRKRLPRSSF